jgi:hypothetical protein
MFLKSECLDPSRECMRLVDAAEFFAAVGLDEDIDIVSLVLPPVLSPGDRSPFRLGFFAKIHAFVIT